MLVTIREYATERLEASDEAGAARRAHAVAYLVLAERTQPLLTGPRQRELLDRLALDHDNLRTATEWAIANDVRLALRLVGSLWRFWHMRGHLDEAESVCARVLALPQDDTLLADRLLALNGAGGVSYWRGEFGPTQVRYAEALEIARKLGDRQAIAEQSYNLAFTYQVDRSDIPRGIGLTADALAIFRELGDPAWIAKALWALAYARYQIHEREAALRDLGEAIPLMRELEDRFSLAWALHAQCLIHMKEGRLAEAQASLAESLRIFEAADDVSGVTLLLMDAGVNAGLGGDFDRAVKLFAAGEKLRDETGMRLADQVEQWQLPLADRIRAESGERPAAADAGRALSRAEAIALAVGEG